MSGMTGAKMLYFICAWIVAGLALLATILLGVAYGGIDGFGKSLECIFVGATACITLLYLSGFFTNQIALFISGITVGCVSLLSLVLQIFGSRACINYGYGSICAWGSGTAIAGNVFAVLFLGLFSTLLLIHLSGKLGGD
jgi:hypothetical protein